MAGFEEFQEFNSGIVEAASNISIIMICIPMPQSAIWFCSEELTQS